MLGSTKVAWKLSKALRSLSAGRNAKLFCFAARWRRANTSHLKIYVKNFDQQRINILHCSASLSDLSEAVTGVQCSGAGVLEKALNAEFFFFKWETLACLKLIFLLIEIVCD